MLVNPVCFPKKFQYRSGMFHTGLNADLVLWGGNRDYDRAYPKLEGFNCYGVIDTLAQFYQKFGKQLEEDDRKLVACFCHIEKGEGPDGWRWHKWGPYYGDGIPTQEYLNDEEEFDGGVYVFRVYMVDNVDLD